MKVTSVSPMKGAYVTVDTRDFVRYSKDYWTEFIATPTGCIEQEVYDKELAEQLEAAYQEYIN